MVQLPEPTTAESLPSSPFKATKYHVLGATPKPWGGSRKNHWTLTITLAKRQPLSYNGYNPVQQGLLAMTIDAVLLGAFERHNLGDLLMGHIFEDLLREKGLRTIHASILENNLTSCSGKKVHSLFDLVRGGLDTNTPILHVGGETASCSFHYALLFDTPLSLPYRIAKDVIGEARRMLPTDRFYPYITPPREKINGEVVHWKNRLFYGIGYTSPETDELARARLAESFSESKFIGFRDRHSLAEAKSIGVEGALLTPDIVLQLSKLVPFTKEPGPEYFLMHFNREFLAKSKTDLIGELSKLVDCFDGGMKIGLAGIANYHDSLEELYVFQEAARKASVPIEVLPSVDLFSICQQIANAAVVASTSLHYRIVAKSYGVNRLTMNADKVNCWSQCNDGAHPYGIEPQKLASTVIALAQSSKLGPEAAQEHDLENIEAHIETISDIILRARSSPENKIMMTTKQHLPPPSTDLWLTSMVRYLDKRNSLITQQDLRLSSRRYLLKRFASLSLPSFLRKRFF